jgi:epoxyqueuosine reductase QueG
MLEKIESFLRERGMDVVGVADTEGWRSPLGECDPNAILKGCRRIVVFGKEIPHPIYAAEKHAIDLYSNVAQNYYQTMDAVAIDAATLLTREGHPSIPLGPYLPILMREGKFWGMVSLKHAAVKAGIGTMGKNTLLATEKFGNRLRLGAVLTTAELPAGEPLAESLCKEGCRVCVDVCPARALDGSGGIDQYKCLKNCTSHPLLSTMFLSQWFRKSASLNKYFQLVTETMGSRYTYGCFECLVKCPHFKKGV